MVLGRYLRPIPLAGLVVAGALVAGGHPMSAAVSQAWVPPECEGGAPPGPRPAPAWYRLDPELDASGTLDGMRLLAGGSSGAARRMALPPESFASGPVAGRIVVGDDDGARSRLRAVDPVLGCGTEIAEVRDAVIRSAIATPDGRTLYEHRVDRATRTDLGVWRRDLEAWQPVGTPTRVLDAPAGDDRTGPIFTTDLRLAADGTLVTSSCGLRECRTRLLDPAGQVSAFGPTGPALGAVDGRLVAWDRCPGLPCPIVVHEPGGGPTRVLAMSAGAAALGGPDGSILLAGGPGRRVLALDVRTGRASDADVRDLLPVDGGSLATSGASTLPGEMVLARDGRVAGPSGLRRLSPAPGTSPAAEEVLP